MEVIQLSGYLAEEKLEIAQRFIVPRELDTLGPQRDKLTISKAALRELIDGYARDAGVRSLEQLIKKLVRKTAVSLLEDGATKIKIDATDLPRLLGKRVFRDELVRQKPRPGVVTGLAWTSMGGDTLSIEARAVRGPSGFKQTGQLGKVMLESSEIAYTTARSLCGRKTASKRFFDEHFVHLHVPAGATPKDGPSAGITMAVALYSLALERAVKPRVAMTGELNLSGHVMPVGGIREKLIAAKRAKVRLVILPRANEPDFEQLPGHVKSGIDVEFAETLEQVIETTLGRGE
jgi:ATP-dependent Lon protease